MSSLDKTWSIATTTKSSSRNQSFQRCLFSARNVGANFYGKAHGGLKRDRTSALSIPFGRSVRVAPSKHHFSPAGANSDWSAQFGLIADVSREYAYENSMAGNRQVWLKSRPNGIPQAENFGIRDGDIPLIAEGEFLVQNHYLSSDPAARGWIADATTYWPRVEIGDTMRAFAVGEIIESRNPRYSTGEKVVGLFGWQEYAAATDKHVNLKIAPRDLPLSLYLGVLGLNGFTAYFGLLDVGLPKAGDTVVVSTAAGAVGSCVGQVAKIKGCRTVGIAGGAEKVRQCLDEFGFDAAIDYKAGIDLDETLRSASPDGVNVYFDNTSGSISDAVLRNLALGARIVICGTASYPSWNPWNMGPRPERHLLVKRSRMQGFLATDFLDRFPEAEVQISQWIKEGRINYREEIHEGLEHAPGSLQRLYKGENTGKFVMRLPVAKTRVNA